MSKTPTLIALVRDWFKADPILGKHYADTHGYTEGMYLETACHFESAWKKKWDPNNPGYAIAYVPSREMDNRVLLYDTREFTDSIHSSALFKPLEFLMPEDPAFFTMLREHLIKGHDSLFLHTGCKIRYKRGEQLPWEWEDGTPIN